MSTLHLLLATGNKHKVKEITAILEERFSDRFGEIALLSTMDLPPHEPPQEDGTTYLENALKKARHYASMRDVLTLADDSGLEVDALDGRPGLFSSRYAPTNEQRIHTLLEEINGVPRERRTARFVCTAVLAHPGGAFSSRTGYCEGHITTSPQGTEGFGFDPVFFVPEFEKTMAELPMEQKNRISHRARAIAQLVPVIEKLVDLPHEQPDNKISDILDT